jgi:hypothetical protein
MHAISVIFVTGSLKRKKSSFTVDLTDVSKKGTKRMRYEYVLIHFEYLFKFLSGVQQSHNIKIANRSFENVAEFKYFGITVTNQNLIHGKIKNRLNFAIIQFRPFGLLVCCIKM